MKNSLFNLNNSLVTTSSRKFSIELFGKKCYFKITNMLAKILAFLAFKLKIFAKFVIFDQKIVYSSYFKTKMIKFLPV